MNILVRDFRLVLFLTLIGWCFYLYMFWKLGNPFPISNRHEFFSIEQCISRVGIIGVTAMAILSGFGGMINNTQKTQPNLILSILAVNCPYTYMTYFIKVKNSKERKGNIRMIAVCFSLLPIKIFVMHKNVWNKCWKSSRQKRNVLSIWNMSTHWNPPLLLRWVPSIINGISFDEHWIPVFPRNQIIISPTIYPPLNKIYPPMKKSLINCIVISSIFKQFNSELNIRKHWKENIFMSSDISFLSIVSGKFSFHL